MGHDGLDEVHGDEHRNLHSRQRGWFSYRIIFGEEWRLLVRMIIFKSWARSCHRWGGMRFWMEPRAAVAQFILPLSCKLPVTAFLDMSGWEDLEVNDKRRLRCHRTRTCITAIGDLNSVLRIRTRRSPDYYFGRRCSSPGRESAGFALPGM